MSDPQTLALIQTLRDEQKARDLHVDKQLAKIHDLVNSQLTEAVNRFRDALHTIDQLKARLGDTGPTPPGVLDPTPPAISAKPPPAPLPDPDKTRAQLMAFIEATKVMALAVVDQGERITALLLERRTRVDTDDRLERRRIFP